jgi:magnesium transporter
MLSFGVPPPIEHLDQPVLPFARKDFPELRREFTVREALEAVRQHGVGEKVIYFYVVDEQEHLLGVVPTRRLLTASPEQRLGEIMVTRVVALPHTSTILEACEAFVLHKFLAFPVIDEQRRILGIVDVGVFTDEVLDLGQGEPADDVFESLGFRISQVRVASSWRAFRLRFPWLLTTITSGMVCALLASAFEATIARALVLAFFITLVLALAESVGIQSMVVGVQALHTVRPTLQWYMRALRHEAGTALLLGSGCGAVVTCIICLWRGVAPAAFVIGGSVLVSLCGACFFGVTVPAVLHRLKLDPKIAAGPVTLALTDVFTLSSYFGLATLAL